MVSITNGNLYENELLKSINKPLIYIHENLYILADVKHFVYLIMTYTISLTWPDDINLFLLIFSDP